MRPTVPERENLSHRAYNECAFIIVIDASTWTYITAATHVLSPMDITEIINTPSVPVKYLRLSVTVHYNVVETGIYKFTDKTGLTGEVILNTD